MNVTWWISSPTRIGLALALLVPTAATAQSSVLATAPDTAAVPVPVTVTALAGEDGFGFRSSDGAFALRFQGVAQYDGRVFPDDPDDTAVDGFDVRRLRGDLRGTLYGAYDFRVHLEYAGSRLEVLDGYLDARWHPLFQLRVGKFKAPVGLERLQSVSTLTFAERGFPTALAPNRDVGVQLQGSVGGTLLTYQVAALNGVADGASGDTDLSDSKDLAARLFVHPFARTGVAALRGLGVGVAGTVGDQTSTPAAPSVSAVRTPVGRGTFLRFRTDGTAANTVLADGRRTRLAPQGYWYWGPIGVLGEYTRSTTEVRRGDATAELEQSAWQLAGSWVLTGEPASYRGITPAARLDPGNGSWGAWEVVARIQGYETDVNAFPLLADPAQSARGATGWTVGVNWYLNRFVRLLANYERTTFDAVPGVVARPDEGVLITRFQVAF